MVVPILPFPVLICYLCVEKRTERDKKRRKLKDKAAKATNYEEK